MIKKFRSHLAGKERFVYIDTDYIANAWLDPDGQYKDQVIVILKNDRRINLYMTQEEFDEVILDTKKKINRA